MAEPRKVRMVRCLYRHAEDPEWTPMGRARTRCPKCGAVVTDRAELERTQLTVQDNPYHVVELREVAD